MTEQVKSGKEILEDFFSNIQNIKDVDTNISEMLVRLYKTDKFTDTNVKNELQILREQNENKD